MSAREDWVDGVDDVDAAGLNALGAEINARQPLDADLTALAALTAPATKLAGIATGATANDTDANLKARANHTGTQSADTITDGTTNKAYTATEKTKLGAISGTNTGDQTSVTGNAGTATALQTARTLDGQSFNGSANITVIAPGTHAATGKTTPVDADEIPIVDSAASNVLKKVTFANLKAWVKSNTRTRPISSAYRPLQGVTAAITSTVVQGFDVTGVDAYVWASAAGKYRFCGTTPVAWSADSAYCVNNNNTLANSSNAYQPITIEFWSNATEIRTFSFTATGKEDVWAIVDDRYILDGAFTHVPSVTDLVYYKLTQTSAVWRKYRISVGTTFSALLVNTGAQVVPTSPGLQVAVVGDSWVSGGVSIADAVSSGVAGIITSGAPFGEFEQQTGVDVWRCGAGGTGYVNPAGFSTAGPYGSTARVAALAAMPAMHAVIAFGSANDSASSPSTVVTAANAAWTAIKTAQPNAALIVVGLEPLATADTGLNAINAALIAAAQAHASVDAVIDIRTAHPVLTGTGYVGTPAGNGNSDAFVSTDTLHLTHHGNRYVASELVRLIGNIPIPADTSVGTY